MSVELLPAGPAMMVHHVTGTYFVCDGYTDAVGVRVQTWALDPFYDQTSHKWYLVHASDGAVHIESAASRRRLTADKDPKGAVAFQDSSDNSRDSWRFVPAEHWEDSYVIESMAHQGYALAIETHLQGNDIYINLTRMWGGPNLSQLWKVFSVDT